MNVKIDDADWAAFEALRSALQKRRRKSVTLSDALRLVIRAGIEASEAVMTKAAATPISAPPAPGLRWETFAANSVRAAPRDLQAVSDLHAKFERRCDQKNLNPHEFIQQMAPLDGSLKPAELHAWYFDGTLPVDDDAKTRLTKAVSHWLEAGAQYSASRSNNEGVRRGGA